MAETERAASLTAFGFPSQYAAAVIVEQTPAQRFVRVLTGLGICWGLALCGLFIPVAHFVLVPTFVVAGIIVAVRRVREDRRLLLVRGTCPRCGAEQEFTPGGRFVNGRSIPCSHCHGNLTLVAAPSPSAP